MSDSNLPIVSQNFASEADYFNNFYQTQSPVSGPQYDAVYTFFLSRTNNNKDAAKSLTSSLLEITYQTGINPMTVLEDFKKYRQNENFKTALIGLFNSNRRNTSKIGFSSPLLPSPQVYRNLRS